MQNENVGREVSSVRFYQHSRHPDRMAPTRVLKPKTFSFREAIWNAVVERNRVAGIGFAELMLLFLMQTFLSIGDVGKYKDCFWSNTSLGNQPLGRARLQPVFQLSNYVLV